MSASPGRWRRALVFTWKYLIAAALCVTPWTSVIVVGWVYRLMRRATFQSWHRRAPTGTVPADFPAFADETDITRPHVNWPNWVLGQRTGRSRPDALWLNIRTGAAGIFNTWVLTLPACVLWLFAWYDGWNNSFNKGYEQATVGPLTGLLGVALFIAAMLYVPMAQARQAATGSWRSFYDFALVWGLVRRRVWASAALAACYSLVSLPVMILKTAPLAFDRSADYALLTDAQVLSNLHTYFFFASFAVIAAYVGLRLLAARLYAGALVEAVRRGTVAIDRLGEDERHVLDRLDLLQVEPTPERHAIIQAAGWAGTRVGRITATAVAVLLWFTFVSQIFVTEFLNYHPRVGWLNQPLVQLPWFRYIPPGLTEAK
ncbi:MAG: hypothetical protein OER86_02340 [Phycisphaerae bacterium]|nr:hypothetical protein [Phycisphaerae bacterium]